MARSPARDATSWPSLTPRRAAASTGRSFGSACTSSSQARRMPAPVIVAGSLLCVIVSLRLEARSVARGGLDAEFEGPGRRAAGIVRIGVDDVGQAHP